MNRTLLVIGIAVLLCGAGVAALVVLAPTHVPATEANEAARLLLLPSPDHVPVSREIRRHALGCGGHCAVVAESGAGERNAAVGWNPFMSERTSATLPDGRTRITYSIELPPTIIELAVPLVRTIPAPARGLTPAIAGFEK